MRPSRGSSAPIDPLFFTFEVLYYTFEFCSTRSIRYSQY
nr:MAG TPA: hypothetical protein [Caudoviricetes sp.]